ncbi:MAG TPA: vWA domain-containing protein [Amycolatopsis sp.]|uniref:vWA domain-containing protein n=1 Tax=Amycolatopsis sp. TaxID=37632 RepID=UPI002B46A8D4|nr:vWA domain-containing protein [Amycolatopsis sp.]HKS44286.1 vWA domain-containing protein [Amycolatopsis sp.]
MDIALCIDVTYSMKPVLEAVKKSALSFQDRLATAMDEKGKSISQLRVKVIAFRDFGDNADDAMEESDFMVLPARAADFERFVSRLQPAGGGDIPESGLEALALAINSAWEKGLDRRRHVIVVFTDAPAHPLGSPEAVRARNYPKGIPGNLDDLFERWGYARSQSAVMDNSAKRLVLFASDSEPWNRIAEEWNRTMHFPSVAGDGLEEFEMNEIINTIANSLG